MVCLDASLAIIAAENVYLRHLTSHDGRTARVIDRLRACVARLRPDIVLVEDGLGHPLQDRAQHIADDVAKSAEGQQSTIQRMSFRRASLAISGRTDSRRCAAILAGQYDVLSERLEASAQIRVHADDRRRDQRPLLAALAIAHATVLEEFLRLG